MAQAHEDGKLKTDPFPAQLAGRLGSSLSLFAPPTHRDVNVHRDPCSKEGPGRF
jgi:hypothetical protein